MTEWQDDDDSDIFWTSNCTDRGARRGQALGDKSARSEIRNEARNLHQVETSRKRSQSSLQKFEGEGRCLRMCRCHHFLDCGRRVHLKFRKPAISQQG